MMEHNKLKFDEIKNWDDEKWIEEIISKVPLSGEFRIDNIYLNIYEKHCEINTLKGQPQGYMQIKALFETDFFSKRGNKHGRIESYLSDILLYYGFINHSNPGAFIITEEGKLFKTKRTFKIYNKYKNRLDKKEEYLLKNYKRDYWINIGLSVIAIIISIIALFPKLFLSLFF